MPRRLFAVIGDPVSHSRSPAMHMAAYQALGLPHTYEKIATTADELPERIAALRSGALAGINVTVPHKTAVLRLVDAIDASARTTGAANTLVYDTNCGTITAHNTDAPALAFELTRLSSTASFANRSALVLGNGGAARAAIFALGSLGVAHVVVRARRAKANDAELAAVLAAANPNATMSFEPSLTAAPAAERSDLLAIVQATTAGMTGAAPGEVVADAVAWSSVPRDAVVLDVVYAPPRTPILARAAKHGLKNDGGLGMLARQGALAFELWLGVSPPFDVMLDSLTRSLASG